MINLDLDYCQASSHQNLIKLVIDGPENCLRNLSRMVELGAVQ